MELHPALNVRYYARVHGLYTDASRDNFTVFSCWGDLILSKFQNQFCTCSAQPGQKCESVSILNTKIPAPLRVGDFVIVRGTDKGYIEYLNKGRYVTV